MFNVHQRVQVQFGPEGFNGFNTFQLHLLLELMFLDGGTQPLEARSLTLAGSRIWTGSWSPVWDGVPRYELVGQTPEHQMWQMDVHP